MSRIGRKIISLPTGVIIDVKSDAVVVRGPKGELQATILPHIQVSVTEGLLSVTRDSEDKQIKAFHGLIRSLLNNHIVGVTQGYKKTLKLVGTGFRATAKGAAISLAVGFSHPVVVEPAAGVKITLEGTDTIHIEGIDKQAVGQMAANIRDIKPPEPYKGKGIRYENEVVRRKQGKAAA